MTHEYMHYVCGIVDKTLKVWNPKDVEEIKCVIRNLRKHSCYPLTRSFNQRLNAAKDWQALGRLGILAFKSTCRKKFMLCDLEIPRVLEPSDDMPFPPAKGSIKTEPYGGTCGVLKFDYTNNTLKGLELAEMSCSNQSVPIFCEGV
jgi:hypothetical protein